MAAHQAPLSLGFSRQEHWSGLPFPSPKSGLCVTMYNIYMLSIHRYTHTVGYYSAIKDPYLLMESKNWVRSLGQEDPLEKGKAAHSNILAWRIPWTVQSMGSQRLQQDWVTFTFTFIYKTETGSQPIENKHWLPKCKWGYKLGVWC